MKIINIVSLKYVVHERFNQAWTDSTTEGRAMKDAFPESPGIHRLEN